MSKISAFHEKQAELERVRREAEEFRKSAIAELIATRRGIDAELRQLGYLSGAEPETAPRQAVDKKRIGTPGRSARRADSHCKICDVLGHDARSHKNQPVKRAFTNAELEAKVREDVPKPQENGNLGKESSVVRAVTRVRRRRIGGRKPE